MFLARGVNDDPGGNPNLDARDIEPEGHAEVGRQALFVDNGHAQRADVEQRVGSEIGEIGPDP